MRTLAMILAASSTGFLVAAILLTGASSQAGVNPPTATSNGDLNGDGGLDVSDAIYLLAYLFRGGSPPVACADTPELLARVDTLEAAVSAMSLLLAEAPALCAERPDRFVDNGDGTITDRCSNLQWQKRTADTSGDGSIDFNDLVNRAQVQQYMANLQLGGHTDWRLPTLPELRGLLDDARVAPAIHPSFVEIVTLPAPPGGTNAYRSASHPSCCADDDFGIVFDLGTVSTISANEFAFVLAVREQ